MLSRVTATGDASNAVAFAHVEASPAQWMVEVGLLSGTSDDRVVANQPLGQGVWHAADSTGYIALDLTEAIPPPETRIVEGIELSPKKERHCPLVDVRHYIKDSKKEQLLADSVKDFLRTHDLR